SDDVIARTDGVTASFLKELLRKAAVVAAESDAGGSGAITVTSTHLSTALDGLLGERNALTRALLGGPGGPAAASPVMSVASPAPFPGVSR
ncbi:MAG: hypothetical protein ABI912_11290, partial [Actinomycetota bacterium]